jgi:hypothetical protein
MPIPKWCDKKSIRTIKRGKATILICCPKKKFRRGKCSVGTRAIDVRPFRGFGVLKRTDVRLTTPYRVALEKIANAGNRARPATAAKKAYFLRHGLIRPVPGAGYEITAKGARSINLTRSGSPSFGAPPPAGMKVRKGPDFDYNGEWIVDYAGTRVRIFHDKSMSQCWEFAKGTNADQHGARIIGTDDKAGTLATLKHMIDSNDPRLTGRTDK